MKVRDFVKSANKSLNVNLSRVYEIKKKYISLYRANMVLLYDEGFISDPTCFDERELRKNVKDFKISGLIRNSGMVHLDSHQVGFALCRNKNLPEEGIRFLKILERVLYYRERSSDIDKFYDTQFPSKGEFTLGLSMSGPKIIIKKPYPMSESIMECFFQAKTRGKEVKKKTFYDKIFNIALEELGLEGNTEDGLFVKGMSRSEEIQFCDLILDGLVALNGSKAHLLEGWLKEHAWNTEIDDRYRFLKTGLFTYIETQKTEFIFSCQSELLNEVAEEYGEKNVVCMSTDCVYYVVEKDKVTFPVGSFIIYSGEEDVICCDDKNTLEGYTGEVYPVSYFTGSELKGIYIGCPFEVYSPESDEKVLVVDLEQTSYYEPGKKNVSWFSYEDVCITFGRSVYQKGIFPEGSLEDKLFRIYGNSESGEAVGYLDIEDVPSEHDLEKAKDKVFKMIVAEGRLKSRRDGLELLSIGNVKEGRDLLRGDFNDSQINVLVSAFECGLSFDQVWNLANPVLTSKVMKDILQGVKVK